MAQENGQEGRWARLREASAALGVSERTLRRRVQAGAAEGRQVATPFGPAWEVWIDSADPPPPSPVGAKGGRADPALLEALHLVERLQSDYRAAEQRYQQQLIELAGRVGYLQAELAQARAALEAPKPEMAPEPAPTTEAVSRPPTSIWRAVVGWLGG